MTKRLTNLIGTGLIAGSGLLIGGCTTQDYNDLVKDTPVEWATSTTRYVLGGDMGNKQNDPWQGTAIVSKQVDADGTITFVLSLSKLGVFYDIENYADQFVGDVSKYNKRCIPLKPRWNGNGYEGSISVYTPKKAYNSLTNKNEEIPSTTKGFEILDAGKDTEDILKGLEK